MDQNITDLVNAAKLKLEAQQKTQETEYQEDIYASMRNEMDEEHDYPEVSYSQNTTQENV